MSRFDGKVAIVTGGASGIGAATVQRLCAEGAVTVVADTDEARAAALVKLVKEAGGRADLFLVDVRDRGAVDELVRTTVDAHGSLDLMFNNAATVGAGALVDMDAETVQTIIDVNLCGVIHGVAAAGAAMSEGAGGAIVNTSSAAALSGAGMQSVYSASKGGVLSLTRSAAIELAPKVRVNAVVPGPVRTPMNEKSKGHALTGNDIRSIGQMQLLGRIGEAREIASVMTFLASDDASFITGAHIVVDGGMTVGFRQPSLDSRSAAGSA